MNSTVETQNVPLDALLAQAPIPPAQALRHALKLSLALRSLHEKSQFCGCLDPSRIRLGAGHAVIEPAATDSNPYAAPELLAGSPADARTDVYAFGAILYQMLTGREPFAGSSPEQVSGPGLPAPLGLSAAADLPQLEPVVFRCLDRNPARRWQSFKLISIELRFLSAAASRIQLAVTGRQSVEVQLREQISRLESALETRIAAFEHGLEGLRDSVSETRDYLRTAFEFVEDKIRSQAVSITNVQSAAKRTDEVLGQVAESVADCNRALGEVRRDAEESAERVSAAVQRIERRVDTQTESIDTLQAITGRTDDLLERVVESIDLLQTFVLERTGGQD